MVTPLTRSRIHWFGKGKKIFYPRRHLRICPIANFRVQRSFNSIFSFLDFLKSTIGLRTLILSNNSLSKIDANIFAHLKQLNEIDLSSNEITKLSADLIEALSGVKIFKIARNQIFTIDNAHNGNEYQFEQMFLSHNQLSVVTGSMFEKFTKL